MGAERDIVARAGSVAGNSIGALAAYIGRSCGHVCLDQHVIAQGFRFYPWMSDEIPPFFNKRFSTGTSTISVTLQCGLDQDGEDPFEACESHAQARELVNAEDYSPSLWLATVTIDGELLSVPSIADPVFIAKHPGEFRQIAEELVAVGVLQAHACALCTAQAEAESEHDDDADD